MQTYLWLRKGKQVVPFRNSFINCDGDDYKRWNTFRTTLYPNDSLSLTAALCFRGTQAGPDERLCKTTVEECVDLQGGPKSKPLQNEKKLY